jgi:predicted  nucleic acid-binding Zn-ribbon protein
MLFGVPIEYLMFGGIGFCLAWLMALMVLPAVHNRAVRLARERYDDLPLSIQEIRAEKDTIRAGFAAATRDLETQLERLREKTVAHATDVARKNQLVERLKQEIDTVTAALRDSESREQTAREALREAKRGFADKDVTLGTAEGEILVIRRELSAKEAALSATEKELSAIRDTLSGKQAALDAAEAEIKSVSARLHDSMEREEAARHELREVRRGVLDKESTLSSANDARAQLQRELSARDAALREAEGELAAVRTELAGKDLALTRAEREIAAIKAEISALTTLLVRTGGNGSAAERTADARLPVEIVPLHSSTRPVAGDAEEEQPARSAQQSESSLRAPEAPGHDPSKREPQRAPIDLVAGPTRLIPSAIPQNSDSVGRALKEIASASKRADEREPGPNQRLRAAFAPLVKTSS